MKEAVFRARSTGDIINERSQPNSKDSAQDHEASKETKQNSAAKRNDYAAEVNSD